MLHGLKTIAKSRVLLVLLVLSGLLLTAAGVVTLVNALHATEPLILHIHRTEGVDRVGTLADYVGMFGFGFVVWAASIFIAVGVADIRRQKRYRYVLIGFALLVALLTLIMTSYIGGLN